MPQSKERATANELIFLSGSKSADAPGRVHIKGGRARWWVGDAYGSQFKRAERFQKAPRRQWPCQEGDLTGRVHYWNEVAYNASGLDHTSVAPGENRVFGEQLGHCRSSRALAIVQITVFDAVNAIKGGYRSYTGLRPVREETSMDATIAHRRRMIRQTLRSGLFLKKEVNYFLAELSGKYGCHHEERNSSQAGVHRQL